MDLFRVNGRVLSTAGKMTTKINCNDEGLYVESHLSVATPKKRALYPLTLLSFFCFIRTHPAKRSELFGS